jgi:hypothetical protein
VLADVPASTSHQPARAGDGVEVKRSQGRRAIRYVIAAEPGRPDAGSAAGRKPVMTNRDKKDSIRGRMAETGEPFNVARRNLETAAAGQSPASGEPYELIEVEVGESTGPVHSCRRHVETFWGRWVVKPDPDTTGTAEHGPKGAYYGVAQTRRGRIAVYTGTSNPQWRPRLADYDTLAEANLPEDIRQLAAEALGIREVIHRDI